MSDPLVSEKLENGLAWLLLCLSVSQFSVDDSILKCGNSRDAGKQTVITEPLCFNNSQYFQLLCAGPTGSGKTLCIANRLLTGMPSKYIANFITFSARTSANQTQDIIDGKLDKRYVVTIAKTF